MGKYSVHSRAANMNDLKESLGECHVDEYRIVSRAASPDGDIVFAEMENTLNACGDAVIHNEACVANSDNEGLISSLKLYGCWNAHDLR